MRLNPWIRCPRCRKIHTRNFIGVHTVCTCGLNLWKERWK